MSFADFLRTLFEIVLVSFTVWGLFHEDRFIAFEDRLFSRIRRRHLKLSKCKQHTVVSITVKD